MMLALLLATTGSFVSPPHSPRLPIFGPGPMFNVGQGNDVADENALLHVYSSAGIVMLGERIGGRRGMWWTVAGYSALTVVHESCFHGGEGPEVRTDLATRIGSALLTAGIYEGLHALGWLKW